MSVLCGWVFSSCNVRNVTLHKVSPTYFFPSSPSQLVFQCLEHSYALSSVRRICSSIWPVSSTDTHPTTSVCKGGPRTSAPPTSNQAPPGRYKPASKFRLAACTYCGNKQLFPSPSIPITSELSFLEVSSPNNVPALFWVLFCVIGSLCGWTKFNVTALYQ